jgi:hypothetical protein
MAKHSASDAAQPCSASGAAFSPTRNYRYALWRRWEPNAPYVLFIGLNPSTADENEDDPTLRRCKRFAADWGYGAIYMANLFALRATDPKEMLEHGDPIGADNDRWLENLARGAGLVVAAWGAHGGHQRRDDQVKTLLHCELKCLGKTKSGRPRHPLYIKADKPLEPLDR